MNDEKLIGTEGSDVGRQMFSEEVQDIIGRSPSWLLRVGSILTLIIILSVLAGSFFISYPDKVSAEILLTTTNPPINLVTGAEGELGRIFVQNNQFLKKGDVLASIYNGTDYNDVAKLKGFLNEGPKHNVESLTGLELGDLSLSAYQYLDARKKLELLVNLDISGSRQQSIKSKIEGYKLLAGYQLEQSKLMERETELAENDFERNTKLFQTEVISTQEFEVKEREYINVRKALAICEQGLSATRIEITSLEMNLKEIRLDARAEQAKLEQSVEQSTETLRSAILLWEEKHLLVSNINGRVTFTGHWAPGQYVEKGTMLFRIEPELSNIVGKLKLPLVNSGKIMIGQKVHIKLDNFPHEQYGMIIGKVKSLTSLPHDKFYLIDIDLPDGLRSTFKQTLEFRQQMSGNADIITEELSVLDRLLYQFRKVYDKK